MLYVKSEDSPVCHWPLGIITELHPGSDNLIRVVTIRMHSSSDSNQVNEFKRPINKLVFLPVHEH